MQRLLQKAADYLRRAIPELQALYVFGSVPTGHTHTHSDLDLAFLTPQPLDALTRFEHQEALAAQLGRDVDLIDLRAASTVMQAEIIRTGHVVWERDQNARLTFEVYVLTAYDDLQIQRRAHLNDIRERGSVYGS